MVLRSALPQPKHGFGVAMADLFHVGSGQIERLHDCDRGTDVAPALLLVERAIGSEQDVIGPEERQSAKRRRACAGECRVLGRKLLKMKHRPYPLLRPAAPRLL